MSYEVQREQAQYMLDHACRDEVKIRATLLLEILDDLEVYKQALHLSVVERKVTQHWDNEGAEHDYWLECARGYIGEKGKEVMNDNPKRLSRLGMLACFLALLGTALGAVGVVGTCIDVGHHPQFFEFLSIGLAGCTLMVVGTAIGKSGKAFR